MYIYIFCSLGFIPTYPQLNNEVLSSEKHMIELLNSWVQNLFDFCMPNRFKTVRPLNTKSYHLDVLSLNAEMFEITLHTHNMEIGESRYSLWEKNNYVSINVAKTDRHLIYLEGSRVPYHISITFHLSLNRLSIQTSPWNSQNTAPSLQQSYPSKYFCWSCSLTPHPPKWHTTSRPLKDFYSTSPSTFLEAPPQGCDYKSSDLPGKAGSSSALIWF